MEVKYYLVIISIISNICASSLKNIDTVWPEDDSIPFPYPTPDPINIISFNVEYIRTPTPLVLTGNHFLLAEATNTGNSLIVRPKKSLIPATAYGGVLYNETYIFFQREFFWDLSLKRAAAVTVNGFGAPLQAVSSFYNKKYGSLEKAKFQRDGIFQAIVFIYVGPTPNLKFGPSERMLPHVRKAGTTITIPVTSNFDFYNLPSLRQDYYAYPGQFYDRNTGKTYFSSTVTVWRRFPAPSISFEQFNVTFGSFLNQFGKPYSNIAARFPAGPRPIKHVILSGIKLKFTI